MITLIPKRKILAGVAPGQVTEPKQLIKQAEQTAINNTIFISREAALKWAMIFAR